MQQMYTIIMLTYKHSLIFSNNVRVIPLALYGDVDMHATIIQANITDIDINNPVTHP